MTAEAKSRLSRRMNGGSTLTNAGETMDSTPRYDNKVNNHISTKFQASNTTVQHENPKSPETENNNLDQPHYKQNQKSSFEKSENSNQFFEADSVSCRTSQPGSSAIKNMQLNHCIKTIFDEEYSP